MTLRFPHHPAPLLPEDQRAAALANPGFGVHFTDHMARARWTQENGWQGDEISVRRPYSLDPAAAVLHYAQEIFEGLKAYRHDDGSVWLFRPDRNARRFVASAQRLALPQLPEEDFLTGIEQLIQADQVWVPDPSDEKSLYLRPYMFAAEAFLGVRPARDVAYGVIASPAGPYFAGGVHGVILWVTRQYTRAAPGGTGAAKCGGNYASSLAAQMEALEHGCDQVLYADGAHREWLEESGTMNLMAVTRERRLVTPPLGTILEGVTRESVLALATDHGLEPQERRMSVSELMAGIEDGSVTELFACGTAAVITPITGLRGESEDGTAYDIQVGSGEPGSTTMALRDHLLAIQYGRVDDRHGWLRRVV